MRTEAFPLRMDGDNGSCAYLAAVACKAEDIPKLKDAYFNLGSFEK